MKNKKGTRCNSERGIALVITLVLVTILVTLLVELTYSTQVNVRIAATYRDDLRAYYVARSGLELAIAVLRTDFEEDQEEKQERQVELNDDLGELWANLTEAVASAQVLEPELFGGGRLVVRITDEDRKINGNLVNEDPTSFIVDRLFLDGEIGEEFKSAVTDWIDQDQEETYPGGAETRYYEGLEIPYPCKDGVMDTISELRMIRGGNEAMGKTFEAFEGETLTKVKGKWTLEELLSAVSGRGHNINVNTAPGPVIMALHEDIDRLQVEETLQDRAADPFPRVDLFRDYFNNSFGTSDLPPNLTVQSEYFSIDSIGIVGEVEKKLMALVRRDPTNGSLKIISWRVE
ncbi:MAG: general secretion pathway protein GspK [bacterium]